MTNKPQLCVNQTVLVWDNSVMYVQESGKQPALKKVRETSHYIRVKTANLINSGVETTKRFQLITFQFSGKALWTACGNGRSRDREEIMGDIVRVLRQVCASSGNEVHCQVDHVALTVAETPSYG